jgi:hypothetical protein
MYRGVERRLAQRRRGPKVGVILLEQDALIECTVRDFSPAGAGLLLPDVVQLPAEFDLTFSRAHHHCITVWRQLDRMGLKFKSRHQGHSHLLSFPDSGSSAYVNQLKE